ncbi:MAG: LLM class flavin-dependent oxidoreductase [Gordonia sp. (in: high G+C Gram-positive bacteria)]
MTAYTPYLALGLTGDQVIELFADPALQRRWDDLPVAFSILGIERLDPTVRSTATLEATTAAVALLAATERTRVLAPVGFSRDHPYNLARRSASAGHLSRGRFGLIFGGVSTHSAPGEPWLTDEVEPAKALADGVDAVRELEQS